MSFFGRLFGREERAATIHSSDPLLPQFFGYASTGYIDPNQATGLATALACLSIVSQSLASIPLNLYRRTENGGREKAVEHPLQEVLHDLAAPGLTAYEAREAMIISILVAGNAYCRLEWNGRGEVTAMHVLDPATVSVERLASGRLRYRVNNPNGGVAVYTQDEILHVRYRLDRNGALGLSPVHLARQTFSLALGQQETANLQAQKGFRPEGALVFPQTLGKEAASSALENLRNKIANNDTMARVLVLDGGVEWKSFSFSAKDAEFLESRKLSDLGICRVFCVPPTVVGILDHGTYSNVEMESRALVTRCLAPLAKRIEQAMNAALLPAESRKSLFIEHDLAGLLRGDLKARYEAYRIGREWGWLSVNEIRGWENMPAVDGGDERLSPLNMAPLGERAPANAGAE